MGSPGLAWLTAPACPARPQDGARLTLDGAVVADSLDAGSSGQSVRQPPKICSSPPSFPAAPVTGLYTFAPGALAVPVQVDFREDTGSLDRLPARLPA